MPEPVDLSYAISLPPAEAIKYFAQKGYNFSWDWTDTWQDAHATAFTVAKAMKMDILMDIRGAVDKAMTEGTTLDTFQKELLPLLKSKGWWGKVDGVQLGSPYRLETIFRTNVQSAYMAGRYKQQMESIDQEPYWQYVAVADSRTRPAHMALNRKVFKYDDPFWDTHYPPNGYKCRCRVRTYDKDEVKKRGLTVEDGSDRMVWEDTPINKTQTKPVAGYQDPETGKALFTDPGFSANPGKTAWKIDPKKYDKKLLKIAEKVDGSNKFQ